MSLAEGAAPEIVRIGALAAAASGAQYDALGNLQAIGGSGGHATPTSSSTNRLSSPGTVYPIFYSRLPCYRHLGAVSH